MSDAGRVSVQSPEPLADGLAALERHEWERAYDLLAEADQLGQLGGRELEAFSLAAYFTARPGTFIEIKERAFRAWQAVGHTIRAAYVALDLARLNAVEGKVSIASGWMRRGERLLEGQPEGDVHGYLELLRSDIARSGGDLAGALEHARKASEIASRGTDPDLHGWALSQMGLLQIAEGAPSTGLALLEEASIAAVNGELSPFASGVICCMMIAACRDLTDYQRASEWIEATDRYCEKQSVTGFPGVCRIHRAEIVAIRGGWERAEQELRRATDELGRFETGPVIADGHYALGEIHRLQGDFEGAEAALRKAHANGRSPHPALALIRLAQGQVQAALTAINAAVAEHAWDRLTSARLLPAQVEISLAAGEPQRALAAVDDLRAIVAAYPSPAMAATLHMAEGCVLLVEREFLAATAELRAAVRSWRAVPNPYEVARARHRLALALRALDDDADADLELRAARDEFQRLGARPDAADAEAELERVAQRANAPVTIRRTFLFTDIVGSTRLAAELGDEVWEQLLARHDQVVRAELERFGGEIVNSTGDGFFATFPSAGSAIDAATAVQRALVGPIGGTQVSVRIGLHSADATQRGRDYSGLAVNVAARVAAIGNAGEIVATHDTLAEAPGARTRDVREVPLRGIAAPMAVASLDWS